MKRILLLSLFCTVAVQGIAFADNLDGEQAKQVLEHENRDADRDNQLADGNDNQLNVEDGASDPAFLSSVFSTIKGLFGKLTGKIKSWFSKGKKDKAGNVTEPPPGPPPEDACAELRKKYPNKGKMGLDHHPDKVCSGKDNEQQCIRTQGQIFAKLSECY